MNKQFLHYVAATILSVCAIFVMNQKVNTVEAKSIVKTVMHDAQAYDLYGDKVKGKYAAYTQVKLDDQPIPFSFKPFAPAYQIKGKKQYIKASNIDGVKRKVKRNSYVYATSSRRADSRLLKKGKTITTYGNSFKFKNGQRYYRIGGPKKQYVKASNLSKIISSNTEETIVKVTAKEGAGLYDFIKDDTYSKKAKKGTKFTVDYAENNGGDEDDPQIFTYHIKGTKYWLLSSEVKAKKKMPVHYYDSEHYSYIKFYKNTDVYNADGTMQDHHGQKIRKQGGFLKVNKLLYIWVPAEKKAELFYHLKGHEFYASASRDGGTSVIDVGDGYVKQKDVKFIAGLKLRPSNTAEEAQQNAKQKADK